MAAGAAGSEADRRRRCEDALQDALAQERLAERAKEQVGAGDVPGHSGAERPQTDELGTPCRRCAELQVEVSLLRRQLALASSPSDARGQGSGERRTGIGENESWQELKHIQFGTDKWFKVASVDYGSAAKKAKEALLEAERDLLQSAERASRFREPWTPPYLSQRAGGEASESQQVSKKLVGAFNASCTVPEKE